MQTIARHSDQHIRISPKHTFRIERSASQMGSAPVLDTLLPSLSATTVLAQKRQQQLANIDSYMLQETAQLLQRVSELTKQLDFQQLSGRLSVAEGKAIATESGLAALATRLNQDRWLAGALNWLQPNYEILAESQEMLEFSLAYETNPKQAIAAYDHLRGKGKVMHCFLSLEQGRASLVLESPATLYRVTG